ncbi:MAG: ABC transporter ATP-binding protein [Chromatiales bacterium]|jgi:lipoprotein-releasing system ATP-binding protein|nr:ABC transporter ATP-binding protein [Chromatiales bacterium]
MPEEVLHLARVHKSYNIGQPAQTEVLHGIDLHLARGDFAALIGPSGSGKSTLLNLIGLLDTPSAGEIHLLGRPTQTMNDTERTMHRACAIGFVFQFHHLINSFSVMENILMPLMLTRGKPKLQDTQLAYTLLAEVGLADHATRRPDELSGGQQQRVAVVRALITRPALLLADEPTGNLDTTSADSVFQLLRRFHQEFGCAVLLVTHDPRLSSACDRTIKIIDGHIVSDTSHIASGDNSH